MDVILFMMGKDIVGLEINKSSHFRLTWLDIIV